MREFDAGFVVASKRRGTTEIGADTHQMSGRPAGVLPTPTVMKSLMPRRIRNRLSLFLDEKKFRTSSFHSV